MRRIFSAILAVAMTFTLIIASPPTSAIAVTDFSGTYYIRNMSSGVFLTPDTNTNGSLIKTKSMNLLGDQVWIVESRGDDYYSIKSQQTGYYLYVNGNIATAGSTVIMTTETTGDGWLWKFTAYNNGYYISSKLNSSYVLSTQAYSGSYGSPATNGSQVYIYGRSPFDGYDQDAWYLCRKQYNLTLDVDYDNAYYSRYGSNVSSRLTATLTMIKQRMIESAGIDVTFSTVYTKVSSYVDSAPNSCASHTSNTTMCSCDTCVNSSATNLQAYHHTNYYNILYRLTNPNQARNIKVFYTGHQTCYSNGYSHTADAGYAGYLHATWEAKDIILMMDFKSDTDHERMMTAYAILQLYGLQSHTQNSGDYSNNCIFGSNAMSNSGVREMCTLCNHCISVLVANANEYNHPLG